MSLKSTYPIKCPKCQTEQSVELHDSINMSEEPELRDLLMANELNVVHCDACDFDFRVDKRLLYSDPARRMMIYWFPGNEESYRENRDEFMAAMMALNAALPESFDPPIVHLVFTRSELVERIYLLEEGLNERIIEYIKYMIYSRNEEKTSPREKILLFNAEDSTAEALCFVTQDARTNKLETVLQFARSTYAELEELFDDDEKTASLMELFPGPYISARELLLQDELLNDSESEVEPS